MESFGSRYKIVRTLGSGGMGVVYLVEDARQGGKLMALKTLRAIGDATALDNFRSEFRNLRGVVHPHLPEMFDFGMIMLEGAPVHYFTSEFVDGKPLDQLCKSWKQPEHLREILVTLSRALAFLHSRGLLHRDLKRENVLASVAEDGSLKNLKLVDFGLSARIGKLTGSKLPSGQRERSSDVAGTLDYLAPELLQGGEPTVQTDLYALGMLLYRLATGRMPFEHEDPLALVKTRTTTEAPAALRFRSDLPVGLSDVMSALLRVRPEERPQSARHVIAFLNEREGTDFAYETAETRTAYIRSAATVTNAKARERLEVLHAKLETATPKPVKILAPRGLGRTRLIRDFAVELQLEGYPVRLVESDADLDATDPVRVMLVPNSETVTRQWLYRVLEVATSAGVWCVVGLSAPDDELEQVLSSAETIVLASMTATESTAMVQATFPDNSFPADFAAELYEWAMGFPSAIQAIFDQLLQQGTLRIGLNGWELLPGARSYELHESVADYLEGQLEAMDEPARELAYGLACSNRGFPVAGLGVLQEQLGGISAGLQLVLDRLQALNYIRAQDDLISLATAAHRAHLRGKMAPETRAHWHQRWQVVWSAPELAEHADCARTQLFHDFYGARWQTPVERAAQIIQDAIAAGQYVWAKRLTADALESGAPEALRPVLLELQSQVAFIEGNMEGAAQILGERLQQGQESITIDNLALFARYAMLEEKLGHATHAEEILLRCKELLPQGPNRWASSVFGTLAWILFKRGESEAASSLAEEGLVRVPAESADAGFALLLNTVATLAFYRGDMDAAALAWQRCLEVNESIRDRKGIANMYNNLGVLAAQSGERLRARALWQKCGEIAREINDVHRLAGIYNNLGIDSLETGALADAEEYYLKSLSLFRKMNAPREQVATLSNLGELAYHRADFTRAQAYWQEAVQLADSTGDHESQIEPLVYWGKLSSYINQNERAQSYLTRALEISRETGAKKGEAQACEGLAELYIRIGNIDDALRMLQDANRLLTEDVDPLALLHLHLTECAIASERNDEAGVKQALERARKVGDIKWDPFTSARTLVYGLLFAHETLDSRERSRTVRQLTPYPDFLWKYYWATGRQLAQTGSAKKALEEYGRAVAVLKALSTRMVDEHREGFLSSALVTKFKQEATELRKLVG